jgi:hypothetical protein
LAAATTEPPEANLQRMVPVAVVKVHLGASHEALAVVLVESGGWAGPGTCATARRSGKLVDAGNFHIEGAGMRKTARLSAVAVAATAASALLATPAQAVPDPAVTGCSFTPLYSTYSGGVLSGLKYYYPRNTVLTVTAGDGNAWQVTVNRNGEQGWMEADCVLFLA